MNLIDTVGVNHVLKCNISLKDTYFLAPDLSEEIETAELIHGRHIPSEIRYVVELDEFNESVYLDWYKKVLNTYKSRSFYNMTGFGDVSIIAAVHALLNGYEEQKSNQLFSSAEPIYVFTNDSNLSKTLANSFVESEVYIKKTTNLK